MLHEQSRKQLSITFPCMHSLHKYDVMVRESLVCERDMVLANCWLSTHMLKLWQFVCGGKSTVYSCMASVIMYEIVRTLLIH